MTSNSPEFNQFDWLKALNRSGRNLKPTTKNVGTELFNYANERGYNVRPGPSTIAKDLGIDKRTVTKAIETLRESGWITLVAKGGVFEGKNTPNSWRLTFPSASVAESEPEGGSASGGLSNRGGPTTLTPRASRPSPPGPSDPDPQGLTTLQRDHLTNHSTVHGTDSFAHSGVEAQGAAGASAPAGAPHMDDEEFQKFWDVYPNRRDRKRAYPFFVEARTRASLDAIVAGAQRYADDPNRDLTKDPKTWLAGECWNDELIPSRPKKKSSTEKSLDLLRNVREGKGYAPADWLEESPSVDAFGLPIINAPRDQDYIDAEVVEVEPLSIEARTPDSVSDNVSAPALTVVKDNGAPDAFTAFLDAYPKPTPPAQRYGAHKAWQAAAKAHGEDRVLKAAQRYTESFEDEGKDPNYAKKLSDWFKDDSFDKHLPHEFEPYVGMNVEKWLDLVTEHRDVKTALRYATGDTFLPEWPAEAEGWTKAEVDAFRESDKDRWFREHRDMHLEVLTRRYGKARNVA
ncbi:MULTISPECIES: helix-turn-helix domain-containing protein [unclassified Dietzia]|uniref:helix-turn-helix domain-containing protein n=1 Tax=unclassified Dietzia TaxID=2617939 RepID=UPI0013196C94|nr:MULTISPECIES: helix-turn-helix domain-containing protein [unclassified Dietzia]QGW24260.1 hypothetical protein GJR88_01888 [Dietzia sp. DQ12-45-1b]